MASTFANWWSAVAGAGSVDVAHRGSVRKTTLARIPVFAPIASFTLAVKSSTQSSQSSGGSSYSGGPSMGGTAPRTRSLTPSAESSVVMNARAAAFAAYATAAAVYPVISVSWFAGTTAVAPSGKNPPVPAGMDIVTLVGVQVNELPVVYQRSAGSAGAFGRLNPLGAHGAVSPTLLMIACAAAVALVRPASVL